MQTGEKATDPYTFFLEGDANRRKLPLTVDSAVAGRLIPAGEGIQMVGLDAQFLTDETRGIIFKDLLQTFALAEVPRNWYEGVGLAPTDPRRAVIEVVYSSIYGDRWRIRSEQLRARLVLTASIRATPAEGRFGSPPERIAALRITRLEPSPKPRHAIRGRAVREALG